jgi:hypothetical protein
VGRGAVPTAGWLRNEEAVSGKEGGECDASVFRTLTSHEAGVRAQGVGMGGVLRKEEPQGPVEGVTQGEQHDPVCGLEVTGLQDRNSVGGW